MDYGLGKVIHLSLWGHIVKDNPVFIKYLDKIIIPLALGKNVTAENDRFVEHMKLYFDNYTGTVNK
jgi:hypothetical protein